MPTITNDDAAILARKIDLRRQGLTGEEIDYATVAGIESTGSMDLFGSIAACLKLATRLPPVDSTDNLVI